MRLNSIELSREPLLTKAKAANTPFTAYSPLISYAMQGGLSLDGIMRGQKGNIALWLLGSNGDPAHE